MSDKPRRLGRGLEALIGSLPASREKVLVVDDSPAQRHYVADCLSRQGFVVVASVMTVSSGGQYRTLYGSNSNG